MLAIKTGNAIGFVVLTSPLNRAFKLKTNKCFRNDFTSENCEGS
jgi:hypothetical protein